MAYNVLIIGSGGREHALGWKIAQSPKLKKLYFTPGNGGTSELGENIELDINDYFSIYRFVEKNNINMTIIGPEKPLAKGLVDYLLDMECRVFGPTQGCAKLESSKVFAKEFLKRENIPTPPFEIFDDYNSAIQYLEGCQFPKVIKADGLSQGKGVEICETFEQAQDFLKGLMVKKTPTEAGPKVVIEEFISGHELSIHALSDSRNVILFPPSRDYKKILDNDRGKNTGGMGAYAPVPWVKQDLMDQIKDKIVLPTINYFWSYIDPYIGCLYPGLMITSDGPKVLEYNVRFGDPEAQVYMRLLKSDLLDIINACLDYELDKIKIEWLVKFAVCIVLASGGYPNNFNTGYKINGIKEAEGDKDIVVFHACTKLNEDLVTSGGRVLSITAIGDSITEARQKVYDAVKKISFQDMYYRSDIGLKADLPI